MDGIIGDTGAKVYYYHTDQVGTVRAITDQSGKVVFNADYFAFGTKFVSNGDFDEPHGFTGKEYDSDTGLYYYNARWYDPDLGRFISEDPAADPNNPNLYSYCGNNGVSRIDPTGQYFWIVVAIAAAIGAIDAYCNGGNPLVGAFVGAVAGAIGWCCGALCGPALAGTLGPIGAAAVGGALSGGIMAALMGENVWAGARRGALSAGISYWLGSVEVGSSASKAPTGNMHLNAVRNWFNGTMGAIVANGGDYKFGAGDVFALCGVEGAIDAALSDSTEQPKVDVNDLEWTDEYGNSVNKQNATQVVQASNKTNSSSQKDGWTVYGYDEKGNRVSVASGKDEKSFLAFLTQDPTSLNNSLNNNGATVINDKYNLTFVRGNAVEPLGNAAGAIKVGKNFDFTFEYSRNKQSGMRSSNFEFTKGSFTVTVGGFVFKDYRALSVTYKSNGQFSSATSINQRGKFEYLTPHLKKYL